MLCPSMTEQERTALNEQELAQFINDHTQLDILDIETPRRAILEYLSSGQAWQEVTSTELVNHISQRLVKEPSPTPQYIPTSGPT
jgi:hypothetical protein